MQIARVCTSIESIERDIGDRDDDARVRINAQIRTASRTYTHICAAEQSSGMQ